MGWSSLARGNMRSLYEHAGGDEALHRLEELFYSKVLADPILKRLFNERRPHHVDHLTWFTAESFGGPDRFTRELGFQHHRRPSAFEDHGRTARTVRSALSGVHRGGRAPCGRCVQKGCALAPRVRLTRRSAEFVGGSGRGPASRATSTDILHFPARVLVT